MLTSDQIHEKLITNIHRLPKDLRAIVLRKEHMIIATLLQQSTIERWDGKNWIKTKNIFTFS